MCYDYFPVSQMFYSLFLFGIIDWMFTNSPAVRNGGLRLVRVQRQWGRVVESVHVRTMGEGDQILACTY